MKRIGNTILGLAVISAASSVSFAQSDHCSICGAKAVKAVRLASPA